MAAKNKFNLRAIMRSTKCPEIVAEGGGWEATAQISAIENWLETNTKEHITYIGNAFSLQMLFTPEAVLSVIPVSAIILYLSSGASSGRFLRKVSTSGAERQNARTSAIA